MRVTDSNSNCIKNGYGEMQCQSTEEDLNLLLDKVDLHCPDDEKVEEDEPLDPRIQNELEMMNKATDLINKFENDLVVAQKKFKIHYADSCNRLSSVSKKRSTYIHRAMSYYDCRLKAKTAQEMVHEATLKYEAAVSMETTAREVQEVAEQCFDVEKSKHNLSWQEMLNHATNKLIETEEESRSCEAALRRAEIFLTETRKEVQKLYKLNRYAISKSKSYYELKAKSHAGLEQQREVITSAESNFSSAKSLYSRSMSNLEAISNEIHVKRMNSSKSDEAQPLSSESDEPDGRTMTPEQSTNGDVTATSTPESHSHMIPSTYEDAHKHTCSHYTIGDDEQQDGEQPTLIKKKRSSSCIERPVSTNEMPALIKTRSMSFPSSFTKIDDYNGDDLGSGTALNRSDSSILDDQCIQGALSHLYFDTECECVSVEPSSTVASICSTPPQHEDYETLPDRLSQFQKQFTLKRSSSKVSGKASDILSLMSGDAESHVV